MDVKKSEKSLCSSLWILLTNRSVCLAFRPRYMGKFLFQTRSAFFRTFRSAVSTIVSLFVVDSGHMIGYSTTIFRVQKVVV